MGNIQALIFPIQVYTDLEMKVGQQKGLIQHHQELDK